MQARKAQTDHDPCNKITRDGRMKQKKIEGTSKQLSRTIMNLGDHRRGKKLGMLYDPHAPQNQMACCRAQYIWTTWVIIKICNFIPVGKTPVFDLFAILISVQSNNLQRYAFDMRLLNSLFQFHRRYFLIGSRHPLCLCQVIDWKFLTIPEHNGLHRWSKS